MLTAQKTKISNVDNENFYETDEEEFKSLKRIAGRLLDLDETRRERLKL